MSVQPRNEGAATTRSYGKKSQQEDDAWKTPLTEDSVNKLIVKATAPLQKSFRENAETYANARVKAGASAKPKMIISDFGFKEAGFNWTYMPPSIGEYQIFPKKEGLRPWRFVFVHSFGYTWDIPYMAKNKSALNPPGDTYGHHPKRWMAALRQLVLPKEFDPKKGKVDKVSIHFCVSRRGDILVSVDLNDIAYHGGGDPKYSIGDAIGGKYHGNNAYTIGIELEPCLGRKKAFGTTFLLDYPDRQLKAFAILIKKFQAVRPIANTVISRFSNQSLQEQFRAAKTTGGYVQHIDVFPVEPRLDKRTGQMKTTGKVDASGQRDGSAKAQFSVYSDGSVGYGWTQLFDYISKVRTFNLATQVFVDRLDDPDFSQIANLSTMMTKGNTGQRAALGALKNDLEAHRRARDMQGQTRQTVMTNGVSQAAALHARVAEAAATASQVHQKLSSKGVTPLSQGNVAYNFEKDQWERDGVAIEEPKL